jgi:hypothetical protein
MRYAVAIIVIIIIIALGGYGLYAGWFFGGEDSTYTATSSQATTTESQNTNEADQEEGTSKENQAETGTERPDQEVIGTSVNGNEITAHHFGNGQDEILFVGGIHGAYEWNTTLVAYELMDYLETDTSVIPDSVTVTVIPALNPDGLQKVIDTTGRFSQADVPSKNETVPGRFNGNNVDLNRNFDCNWQSEGTWRDQTVDGGDQPFSEPESQALRDYVQNNSISAAVIWYSAAGEVIASSCGDAIGQNTRDLVNAYASASGYAPKDSFDYYTLTGDAADWLAKQNIPAISVLLSNHEDVEWSENKAGIQAILESYDTDQ